MILLQFEVVSVDALKHSLFCVLSHSALAADRLKNRELILPVVVFGQTMQALCIAQMEQTPVVYTSSCGIVRLKQFAC